MTQYMVKILTHLHKKNFKTPILSIDRYKLRDEIGLKVSDDKLGRSILYLKKEDYIAEGVKVDRNKKYYITSKGLDFLEESYEVLKKAKENEKKEKLKGKVEGDK